MEVLDWSKQDGPAECADDDAQGIEGEGWNQEPVIDAAQGIDNRAVILPAKRVEQEGATDNQSDDKTPGAHRPYSFPVIVEGSQSSDHT
jgi:hypothetical protein